MLQFTLSARSLTHKLKNFSLHSAVAGDLQVVCRLVSLSVAMARLICGALDYTASLRLNYRRGAAVYQIPRAKDKHFL